MKNSKKLVFTFVLANLAIGSNLFSMEENFRTVSSTVDTLRNRGLFGGQVQVDGQIEDVVFDFDRDAKEQAQQAQDFFVKAEAEAGAEAEAQIYFQNCELAANAESQALVQAEAEAQALFAACQTEANLLAQAYASAESDAQTLFAAFRAQAEALAPGKLALIKDKVVSWVLANPRMADAIANATLLPVMSCLLPVPVIGKAVANLSWLVTLRLAGLAGRAAVKNTNVADKVAQSKIVESVAKFFGQHPNLAKVLALSTGAY